MDPHIRFLEAPPSCHMCRFPSSGCESLQQARVAISLLPSDRCADVWAAAYLSAVDW